MVSDLKTLMEDIARAIRFKTGVSDKINAQDFPQKIREIGDNSNTSALLNIAYGDISPEDTSKLWIKANEPKKVEFITSGGVNIILNHGDIAIKQSQELYFDIYNGIKIGVDSVFIGNENNQAENCEAYLYQNDTWVQI